MRSAALLLICIASRANGHGYMTKPKSRQAEAFEANGWPNEVAEYDPHGVAAGGMYSECADCSSRRNYGPNPWSAPGTARAVDFVMGGSGGNMLGVCGASPSRDNDYNTPLDGHWGMSAKTTYKAGDVIDVAWCVSADHGGVPQFRLCDDEGLVSAVTTPGYKPTLADHEALEQCFQRGLLRCDGVESNTCDQIAECDTYAKDWEACADPGKYLHCSGGAPGERGCKNTAETCAHGILARYKLKIPESTKASSHTILSYRWDTYENNEVFVGCADIAITTDGGEAAPDTPRPTLRPTKAADVATPRPTKPPTKDEIDWDCSGYSQSCHRVDHNNNDAFKALGSTTSWGTETVCANKGKKARWSTHSTVSPLTSRADDINAQEGFPGAPEEYFVRQHYDYVIDSLTKYIPPSKAVIGFEPGPQAYTGVSGGVEHEKSIISYLNGKVGGIMFWAVNEGASGGPNGNGQTTGANSVALANYAAAL